MKKCPVDAIRAIFRLPTRHIEEYEIPEFAIRICNVQHVGHGSSSAFGSDHVVHMLHYLAMLPLFEVVTSDGIRICSPSSDADKLIGRGSGSRLGRAVVRPEQSPDEIRLASGPRSGERDADTPRTVVSIHLMRLKALHGVVVSTA